MSKQIVNKEFILQHKKLSNENLQLDLRSVICKKDLQKWAKKHINNKEAQTNFLNITAGKLRIRIIVDEDTGDTFPLYLSFNE